MNKIFLIGRISTEIELRYTQNNMEVVTFNLAVNRDKDNADFIKINAFRQTAKLINDYCKKGDRLAIEGSLRVSNYEDKNGNRKYDYNVLANKIEFLEAKKETKKQVQFENQTDDDDLPF